MEHESCTRWTEDKERKELRRAVDEWLAEQGEGPIAAHELSWALRRPWAQDTDDLEGVAQSVAYQVGEVRAARKAGYEPGAPTDMISLGDGREFPAPPKAPSWWRHETIRRFARVKPLQAKALEMVGRRGEGEERFFLTFEELYAHLVDMARAQRPKGDALSLAVPCGLDDQDLPILQQLIAWRGASPLLEEQPLWRLAMVVDVVVKKTGCGEDGAIAFLLCDQIPHLPWVGTRIDFENGVIEMTVRDARVSPTDVAIAYRSMRDAFYGKRRRGREWPYLAEAFVGRLESDGEWTTWETGFLRFKAEHPDQPYASNRTFKQAVNSRRKRS